MIKQRKRVSTKGILNASNWVRENIQTLTDLELGKAEWCEKLSEGSGEKLTIPTAIEILEACGVRTARKSPEETIGSRVLTLEQQVVGLLRSIKSIQAEKAAVLNMLRVNKWIRVNLDRLYLLTHTVEHWQELIEEGSGVNVPLDVVEKLCRINRLTTVKILKGEI